MCYPISMREANRTSPGAAARMAGISIVEVMVAITLSLIVLAAVSSVFVSSSAARNELERTSRQIENGRYATDLLTEDIRVAGFFGELDVATLGLPAAAPNPCSTTAADWNTSLRLHIQGSDDGTGGLGCLPADVKPGTDVLVVRRASTCAAGVAGCDAATSGLPYVQVALCGSTNTPYALGSYGTASFSLQKKDCTTTASLRQYLVHIYYVSTNNGAGANTPTLKRLELSGSQFTITPLVEGIEDLQIEYGIDTDGDGKPDGYSPDPSAYAPVGCTSCNTVANWANVVTVHLHILARNTETTPGYQDKKTYTLGLDATGAQITAGPFNDGYRRHVYSNLVRVVNPAGRRDTP